MLARLFSSSSSPRALNSDILKCTTANQLERLVLRSNAGSMDFINIATAFSGLARLKSRNAEVWEKLLLVATPMDFRARELSNICHSIAKGGVFKQLPPVLLSKAEATMDLSKCDPQSASNLVWAFAKLGQRSPQVFNTFTLPPNRLGAFKTQGLVNILWSFATIGDWEQRALELQAIGEEIARRDSFQPQDISNTLWSFAALTGSVKIPLALLDCFAKQIIHEKVALRDFREQDLVNVMHALAVLNVKSYDRVLDRLAQHILSQNDLQAQSISKLLWALATLRLRANPVLFQHLGTLAIARGREFNAQDIANTLWAFASLAESSPEIAKPAVLPHVFQTLLCDIHEYEKSRPELKLFKPQSIATILWACSKVGFHAGDAVLALAEEMVLRDFEPDGEFTPQVLSMSMLALATLDVRNMELCEKVANHLTTRPTANGDATTLLQRCNSQDIGNLLWAFARMSFRSKVLCSQLALEITAEKLRDFNMQNLSNSLYALAIFDFRNETLLDLFANELCSSRRNLQDFTTQGLTTCMWAFACLDALERDSVKRWFNTTCCSTVERGAAPNPIVMLQLFQTKLAWSQVNDDSVTSPLIESLYAAECIAEDGDATACMVQPPEKSSLVHLQISNLLRSHFPDLQDEVKLLNGIYVDIFIPSRNVVVEVDGPFHFFANDYGTRNGNTEFKIRLLERAAFRVYSINVKTFDHMRGEPRQIEAFFRALAKRIQEE